MSETTTKTTKTVTIENRGGFHDDSFFKDSWDSWDNAMKDVVQKWDKDAPASNRNNSTRTTTTSTISNLPSTETRNIYRQIRSSNVTSDDSQAVSCTEEDDKFQMVIDVKDFKPEGINVKVVDDKIVVEGKIEKKEGNSISTQTFVRRFMLPSNVDFARITSALSKDGVLKINAPKLPNARPALTSSTTTTRSSFSSPSQPQNAREVTTFTTTVPDRRGLAPSSKQPKDEWSSSFDEMVEKSQREMQDMMNRHTIHTSVEPPAPAALQSSSLPNTTSVVATAPKGAVTSRDVIRKGDTVTEREEKRWEDRPAPGVTRQHHAVTELSKLKGHDGTVLGNQERRKQESEASGENEEILPDGTKRKTFTKSYETRQVFTSSSSHPKAL